MSTRDFLNVAHYVWKLSAVIQDYLTVINTVNLFLILT